MDDYGDTLEEYCSIVDQFGCEAYSSIVHEEKEWGECKTTIRRGPMKVARWIRVEAKIDDSLANVRCQSDVWEQITASRATQATYGNAELYRRFWEPTVEGRKLSKDDPAHSISVAQFNALAEGLSSSTEVKTPFPVDEEQRDTRGYGGFTNIHAPHIVLDFSLRRWRLIEVLLGQNIEKHDDSGNKDMFDIIAIEEVDRFRGFFAPVLRLLGYDGVFMPKMRSPGVQMGWYSDGCALFWRREKFELITQKRLSYKTGNQVLMITTLRHRPSGKTCLVTVTHLKAQKSEQNEMLRHAQVKELVEHVQDAKESVEDDCVVLVMGDFNADPPQEIQNTKSAVRKIVSSSLFSSTSPTGSGLKFRSAYLIDPPKADFFTTWKTRGDHTTRRIIDYIFHTDNSKCLATLSLPSEKEMEGAKLPGLRFPSDHMLIAAKLKI